MQSRAPTPEEAEWLKWAVQIPCLACSRFHNVPDTPAEYHHIEGKNKAHAHLMGFSLCVRHHRHKDNRCPRRWVSRHGDGKAAFEKRYTSEYEFMSLMHQEVEKLRQRSVNDYPRENGKGRDVSQRDGPGAGAPESVF